MSTPTIIRYKGTSKGFAVVITVSDNTGITAAIQEYYAFSGGRTELNRDSRFSSEQAAITCFERNYR